jgi:hypothetical protein
VSVSDSIGDVLIICDIDKYGSIVSSLDGTLNCVQKIEWKIYSIYQQVIDVMLCNVKMWKYAIYLY